MTTHDQMLDGLKRAGYHLGRDRDGLDHDPQCHPPPCTCLKARVLDVLDTIDTAIGEERGQ